MIHYNYATALRIKPIGYFYWIFPTIQTELTKHNISCESTTKVIFNIHVRLLCQPVFYGTVYSYLQLTTDIHTESMHVCV